jgi:hypothetical protein
MRRASISTAGDNHAHADAIRDYTMSFAGIDLACVSGERRSMTVLSIEVAPDASK